MKLSNYVLALAIATPTLASSQDAAKPAGPQTQAAFATIQDNVAEIVFAPEQQRWLSNIDLWKARLDKTGKLEKADIAKMQKAFTKLQANVAKLIAPAEKERWIANRDLWQIVMGMSGMPAANDAVVMTAVLAKMQANVANIADAQEKERWAANTELWKSTIAGM